MTISYTREVATCDGLGVFWKLLFRWRGSIYKLVWQNLVVYLVFYFSLSLLYRFVLSNEGKVTFEQISVHCQRFSDLIPVTFVLGFYVSIIITRWWGQYKIIPWPDSCCLFISTCLHGHDERGRLMRRTIARYLIVALIQTLRMTSVQVKKRFPTLGHLSDAGIITESERKIIDALDEKCIQHPKYWMSLVWAGAIVTRAKKEGRIKDDFSFNTIINEINKFRSGCGGLLDYDWISIPLVYTQVVTLAVYTFFMSSLMGRQFLEPEKKLEGHEVDMVVPIFTFLQFFFYMGWLKVAEALINPFGEDDDDFEMNWLIDRNLQVSYLIVDDMHAEHPELVKDQYWDEGVPDELPYTVASEQYRPEPFVGSTMDVEISPEDQEIVFMEKIEEGDEEVEPRAEESDPEMNQISIGKNTFKTDPLRIRNGITSTRGSGSTIQGSTQGLSRGSPRGSRTMMGMLQRLIQRSSTHLNLNSKMGSTLSVASKATTGHGRMRRRRRRLNEARNSSRASNMSSAFNNSPQGLSRIQTKENDIFKMSSTSSINTLRTESDFPSRSNSDAHALMAVRELLKKDLNKYQGTLRTDPALISLDANLIGDPSNKSLARLTEKKYLRSKSESFAHTKMLKSKLEQVQKVQKEIMKDLDSELAFPKEDSNRIPEMFYDSSEIVNILELKTLELKDAIKSRSREPFIDLDLDPSGGSMSPVGGMAAMDALATSIPHQNRLKASGLPGLVISVGASGPPSAADAASPTSTPLYSLHAPNKSLAASLSGHNIHLANHPDIQSQDLIFDPDTSFTKSEDSQRGFEVDSTSEMGSSIDGSNSRVHEAVDGTGNEWDSWTPDNLGTIQELPELGYQSDSSDTDQLIVKQKKKSPNKETGIECEVESLPTVQEEKEFELPGKH